MLEPLQQKHIPFLVTLLSQESIQKTLFRSKTTITPDKEAKSIERMYPESGMPKEITYILTIKTFLQKKSIGYVKIKLIDWTVKSCYLSVAILEDKTLRGKGYATATYEAFFDYLFSIGFLKIYGRTYEQNTETIKLNDRTGFRFIGRQSNFIIYPNKTSADALFFEKLSPKLKTDHPKYYGKQLSEITAILLELHTARASEVTVADLRNYANALSIAPIDTLPLPLTHFITDTISELNQEINSGNVSIFPKLTSFFHVARAENAIQNGLAILAQPVTKQQYDDALQVEQEFNTLLRQGTLPSYILTDGLSCGVYSKTKWRYLSTLFLGLENKYSIEEMISKIIAQG